MASRFLTILTGRNLPKIRQPREAEPSTINEKRGAHDWADRFPGPSSKPPALIRARSFLMRWQPHRIF